MSHSVWFLIVFCHSIVCKFRPNFFQWNLLWKAIIWSTLSQGLGRKLGLLTFSLCYLLFFFKDLDISIIFYNTVVCNMCSWKVALQCTQKSQSWLANGTYIHLYFDQNSEPSFSITHRKYSKSLFFFPFQQFHYLRSRFWLTENYKSILFPFNFSIGSEWVSCLGLIVNVTGSLTSL